MSKNSMNDGPRFVKRVKKGRYIAVILVLAIACGALGYLYLQADSENSDLKRKIRSSEIVTTTTKAISPRVTSSTVPPSGIAKIDLIARNNDSNKTKTRIETDFEGKVVVTQVSSDTAIAATIIVVNNPAFESLAQEIVEALGGTTGLVPEGQQASVADVVIYVKS